MISIIIPALNEEDFLENTLKEIKKQKLDDYEIIVADAGSKDNTIKIAKNYGCRVIEGGIPAEGRNRGADKAKGNLFLFIDADLVSISGNSLKKGIKEFKKKDLDAASFPVKVNGNLFDKICFFIYNSWARLLQLISPYGAQAILVKKEIHYSVNGFNKEIKVGEDHFYMKEIAKKGKVRYLCTKPLIFSARRLDKEGRITLYFKYILTALHMTIFGPLKSNKFFSYKFDHYKSEDKKE